MLLDHEIIRIRIRIFSHLTMSQFKYYMYSYFLVYIVETVQCS